jgi:hypothetical protein
MGDKRGAYRFMVGRPEGRERDRLKDLNIDGRTTLKLILRKWDGKTWTGLIWLRKRTGGGCL